MDADPFRDIERLLPNTEMHTYIDVGANVGQTVRKVRQRYRRCSIHAIEPVADAYTQLLNAWGDDDGVHCHRLALGQVPDQLTMYVRGTWSGNSFLSPPRDDRKPQLVTIERGDQFCKRNGIEHVSMLKVDAEGYDLEVLKGFEPMLVRDLVDIVQVEAGLNKWNKRHIDMRRIETYMRARNYGLFGAYEVVREPSRAPYVRRANLVYISRSCALLNQGLMPDD